jgi:hypothetical protein
VFWLGLLIALLFGSFGGAVLAIGGLDLHDPVSLVSVLVASAIGGGLAGLVIHFTCLNAIAHHLEHEAANHCWNCAYPLRGLPTDVCPECGQLNSQRNARAN